MVAEVEAAAGLVSASGNDFRNLFTLLWCELMWFERTDDANELGLAWRISLLLRRMMNISRKPLTKIIGMWMCLDFFERVKLHERVLETFAKCAARFHQ